MRPPATAVVDGRRWQEFVCEYDSPDGTFGFSIMAVSHDHAAAMLCDLKASARLLGECGGTVEADNG